MSESTVFVLNGPNLNLLGTREPERYGSTTLGELEKQCVAWGEQLGLRVHCHQTNSESELIEAIHAARDRDAQGIVINAGAYSHTSLAIRDALVAVDVPTVEVHLTNIYARESFRHYSYLSAVSRAVIAGAGTEGYAWALQYLAGERGRAVSAGAAGSS